jgi:L-cysteine desulfidase
MQSYCKEQYIEILKKELVPAMGCTEPIALAFAAAKAKEVLGEMPERLEVLVSPGILKNGMGVGIPGTGMIGLEIAAAIGAIGGDASKELNVLESIKKDDVSQAQQMVDDKKIKVGIKTGTAAVFIEVKAICTDNFSRVIIEEKHNQIVYIEKNSEVIFDKSHLNNDKTDEANQILVKKQLNLQ